MKRLLNTLYVTNPDAYLSLDGENVAVLCGEETLGRFPMINLQSLVYYSHCRIKLVLLRIILNESWEEERELRCMLESFLKSLQITDRIFLQFIGLCQELEHIVVVSRIFQGFIRVMKCCLGILHLVSTIHSPVSR